MRRLLLLAVIVAAPICGAARATDDTPYPVLYVSPNNQGLGIPVTLSFRAFHLAELARTMRITITIPAAYSVNLAFVAGRAEVRRALRVGGRATLYTGRIVASRRAWAVQVRSKDGSELTLPLSLAPQPHGYVLTLSVPPDAGILSGFDLAINRVFRNPKLPRKYRFDARVSTGRGSYQLRSYENLAARLSLRAAYSKATRWLTVTGAIKGDPRARTGATVFVYVAQTPESSTYKNLAVVRTRRGGRLTYRTRIFPPPVSVFAYADSLHRRGQTYDTITSAAYAVRQSR
jgi:hypothetical protein